MKFHFQFSKKIPSKGLQDKKNVLLLEGNHEMNGLRKYANDDFINIEKEDRPILEKYCDKVYILYIASPKRKKR